MAGNTYTFLMKDNVLVPAEAFDRRVSFQKQVLTPDDYGGYTRSWQLAFKTWAHIEGYRGQEVLQNGQIWPSMFSRVLIRYRPSFNVDASMRMLQGSRSYNIRAVWVPAEARRVIELLCEELQAQGTLHNAATINQI